MWFLSIVFCLSSLFSLNAESGTRFEQWQAANAAGGDTVTRLTEWISAVEAAPAAESALPWRPREAFSQLNNQFWQQHREYINPFKRALLKEYKARGMLWGDKTLYDIQALGVLIKYGDHIDVSHLERLNNILLSLSRRDGGFNMFDVLPGDYQGRLIHLSAAAQLKKLKVANKREAARAVVLRTMMKELVGGIVKDAASRPKPTASHLPVVQKRKSVVNAIPVLPVGPRQEMKLPVPVMIDLASSNEPVHAEPESADEKKGGDDEELVEKVQEPKLSVVRTQPTPKVPVVDKPVTAQVDEKTATPKQERSTTVAQESAAVALPSPRFSRAQYAAMAGVGAAGVITPLAVIARKKYLAAKRRHEQKAHLCQGLAPVDDRVDATVSAASAA